MKIPETTSDLSSSIDIMLVHLIATSRRPVSRTDLANITGLSKMAVGNHVSTLLKKGILSQEESRANPNGSLGRHPVYLKLSSTSPCILGVLIKRNYCQAVLTNISGEIIDMEKILFPQSLTAESLLALLFKMTDSIISHSQRQIIGCGISCIGPINNITGCILNPPDFYGIENLPIVSAFEEHTGLSTYLVQDANAGGLAEKLYGRGIPYDDFMYLHIENGIGLSFILNGSLFTGFSGQSGEIGHTSINFNGPKCTCGNTGCLELYANLNQMQDKISQLLPIFKESPFHKIKNPDWNQILSHASDKDPIAIAALDEFCGYLAHALANVLTLLDFSTIIVGYNYDYGSDIIEKMLGTRLRHFLRSSSEDIKILHSQLGGNAPLIGSAAIVANEVFQQRLWKI